MMTDDKSNFDDNEFDDLDDLGDEFDDGMFDDDWDDPDPAIDDQAAPAYPQKKSFIQKFFMPIVIIVVVIFGLLFAAGQGWLSSDSSQNTDQTENVATESQNSKNIQGDTASLQQSNEIDLIPLDPAQDAIDNSIPDNNAAEPIVADAPLTPDPFSAPTDISDDMLILEDLDLAVAEPIEQQEEQILNTASPSSEVIADAPSKDQVITLADELTSAPDMLLDLKEEPLIDGSNNSSDSIEIDAQAVVSEETITADIATLEGTYASLQQKNNDLQISIDEKLQKIAALDNALKMAELKRQQQVQSSQVAKPQPSVTNAQPKPTTATKAAPVKQQKLNWKLRGARPGAASISLENSKDIKQVEIGDYVYGIGKIQSIQVENGRWVVRGSQKNIYQ